MNTEPISEGSIAKFYIVADRPLLNDKRIHYQITENGEYSTQTNDSVLLEAGEISAKIDIATNNDSMGEANGSIGLSIGENDVEGYKVNDSNNSASIDVLDDDEPVISIDVNKDFAIEGSDSGVFSLYSVNPLSSDIAINFRIDASENVIDYPRMVAGNPQLSLNSGTLDGILSVPLMTPSSTPTWVSASTAFFSIQLFTIDDSLVSPNEEVRVVILEGTGYKLVESSTSSTIDVIDNDEYEVSITSLTPSVTEGSIAEFQLTSTQPVTSDLTINLQVLFEGDFFNRVSGPDTDQIPAGQSIELYRVGTQIDNLYENNGKVTVMLSPGVGYYPNTGAKSSSIVIEDNDEPPGFSILANLTSIVEGEDAEFTIKTSQSTQSKRTIEGDSK